MKHVLLFACLSFPGIVLANAHRQIIEHVTPLKEYPKDSSMVVHHTNLHSIVDGKLILNRTLPYPTHVVRMTTWVDKLQMTCEKVIEEIDSFYSSRISHTKFFYNSIIYCGYDPKTDLAVKFSIFSFFDPLDDGTIEYTKTLVQDINGKDLLGAPFVVEPAKGLIVAMNVDAGMSQDAYASVLLRHKHDNENYFFPSNYEMIRDMITDVYQSFYSNDPKIVLPFYGKWFKYGAEVTYRFALPKCDYVLLQPERIFLMGSEPVNFTSPLRMYYGHKCEKYANKRCL